MPRRLNASTTISSCPLTSASSSAATRFEIDRRNPPEKWSAETVRLTTILSATGHLSRNTACSRVLASDATTPASMYSAREYARMIGSTQLSSMQRAPTPTSTRFDREHAVGVRTAQHEQVGENVAPVHGSTTGSRARCSAATPTDDDAAPTATAAARRTQRPHTIMDKTQLTPATTGGGGRRTPFSGGRLLALLERTDVGSEGGDGHATRLCRQQRVRLSSAVAVDCGRRLGQRRHVMLGRAAGRWCRRAATKAAAAVEISVDRSELGVLAPPFQGTFATPLQEEIHRFISVFGPISVAEYMRRALLHPKLGYYTTGSTPFGSAGDFVTSPEVSQLFGEMVGVWATAVWHGLGSPRDTRLVEFGPGNGTMMCDVLKTVKRLGFKPSGIHLIEPSPMLREKQKAVLSVQHADVPVQWDSQLANVETGDTCPIFFAHEFLDALPIHQFQFTEKGWRERMLAIGEHEALQVVLSRKPTPASALLLGSDAVVDVPANPAVGECIEVSPEVQLAVEQISSRVVMQKGAALLVDYGQDRPSRQSVRGVRNHEFVPFLESPGQVDVTGDVDFSMVRKVARVWGADQIRVMPTIQQGDFLLRMGIAQRVESLVKLCPDDADTIITGYERLVDPEQMGSIYKCSAMVHASFNGEFPGFPTPS